MRDADGEDLPTLDAARTVAVDVMSELLPMKQEDLWRHKTLTVSVKDETGRLVAVITATATSDPVARPDAPPEF